MFCPNEWDDCGAHSHGLFIGVCVFIVPGKSSSMERRAQFPRRNSERFNTIDDQFCNVSAFKPATITISTIFKQVRTLLAHKETVFCLILWWNTKSHRGCKICFYLNDFAVKTLSNIFCMYSMCVYLFVCVRREIVWVMRICSSSCLKSRKPPLHREESRPYQVRSHPHMFSDFINWGITFTFWFHQRSFRSLRRLIPVSCPTYSWS